MTYSEYETTVLQSLNECEQFKHLSFDDLKDSIYNEFEYGDNLKQFYEEGKSVEEATDILDAGTWIFM